MRYRPGGLERPDPRCVKASIIAASSTPRSSCGCYCGMCKHVYTANMRSSGRAARLSAVYRDGNSTFCRLAAATVCCGRPSHRSWAATHACNRLAYAPRAAPSRPAPQAQSRLLHASAAAVCSVPHATSFRTVPWAFLPTPIAVVSDPTNPGNAPAAPGHHAPFFLPAANPPWFHLSNPCSRAARPQPAPPRPPRCSPAPPPAPSAPWCAARRCATTPSSAWAAASRWLS